MEMEKILKKVEEDKVRFVLLQFTDINGIVKNLTIDNYINENFNVWSFSDNKTVGIAVRRIVIGVSREKLNYKFRKSFFDRKI